MKYNKQKKDNAARWLVAVRHPLPKPEIFAFSKKKEAIDFIKDISEHNAEWALAKATK